MNIRCLAILAAIIAMSTAHRALAQVPFYSPQATSADPVIAVATDGAALNVPRAAVSDDHKYVTLDMNPQLQSLHGIQTFTFQKPGLGFVGSPAAIATAASVLDRPGMTLIAPAHP